MNFSLSNLSVSGGGYGSNIGIGTSRLLPHTPSHYRMDRTSCAEIGQPGVGLMPAGARPKAVIQCGGRNGDAANFAEWFKKEWLILCQVLKQPR
jgi:hypothetical protein